eukprot:CAMPEP_0119517476 /NCGR_PEP_ID=MMETSP1344-20130328/34357_1 /TAXON_ID=236787 /ORGANISM="Florenciella parvula, Strain CCMP2471" /LENGTH=74 /DNA_ID=CAMNT_0007555069 /DNA_START=151 /DNA_END=372 /DNA_ORIENTATION=+
MASLSSSSDPAQLLSRAEAAEARVAVADTEIAELKAKVAELEAIVAKFNGDRESSVSSLHRPLSSADLLAASEG